MKVDMAQTLRTGEIAVRTATGSFASSLKEGDNLKAEVLSSYKGIIVMRTDDGQTFKARPEPDVMLLPGDKVLLEMVGKDAGIVSLAIREEYAVTNETAGRTITEQEFGDKTLLSYGHKLAELNMPVTEESARTIRELLALNPGMNPDEAAFIASNKLSGDENLIKAAISLLSDGEKTDAILERLIILLQSEAENSEFSDNISEDIGTDNSVQTQREAQQSRFMTEGADNGAERMTEPAIAEQSAVGKSLAPPQPPAGESAHVDPDPAPLAGGPAQDAPDPAPLTGGPAQVAPDPAPPAGEPVQVAPDPAQLTGESAHIAPAPAPPAGESVQILASLLDKVFTRIENNDKDLGIRLKNAKEELYARLLQIEETISRAATPVKTPVLEQTRRLLDHIRLLESINQYAYMQIPVQIGGDRKTAELYMFKKRAGKRLDPENVNILLALELESMGHWEGFINFRNKDVSIRMEVPGVKEKEFFSENTVLLHELLAEAGFRLVNTDIIYSEKETRPLTALSVLAKHISGRVGIDFTV